MSEELHESLMEKISDKIHGHDSSSSSSDGDSEKNKVHHGDSVPSAAHVPPPEVVPAAEVSALRSPSSSSSPSMKSKMYRLFGREQPVHKVLGGGKPADVFLRRNKKISATVIGVATVIWFLFELLQYHLLTLVCHILIFTLAVLFLWSNASKFINKAPPRIPDVHLPENALLEFASAVRFEINRGLVVLRDIASGKDLKKFLAVIAGLWVVSVVGGWFNFLTLVYLRKTSFLSHSVIQDHISLTSLTDRSSLFSGTRCLLCCTPSLYCMRNTKTKLMLSLRRFR